MSIALSHRMRETLGEIARGEVTYDGLTGSLHGSRATVSTQEALERRGLVRIDYAHPLPDQLGLGRKRRANWNRWPVVLTDAGREQVDG